MSPRPHDWLDFDCTADRFHHLQVDCSICCHIGEGEDHPLVIDWLLAELQRRLISQNIHDQQALRPDFLSLCLKALGIRGIAAVAPVGLIGADTIVLKVNPPA